MHNSVIKMLIIRIFFVNISATRRKEWDHSTGTRSRVFFSQYFNTIKKMQHC